MSFWEIMSTNVNYRGLRETGKREFEWEQYENKNGEVNYWSYNDLGHQF